MKSYSNRTADGRSFKTKPTRAELERRRLRDHERLERAWRELTREVRP